MSQMRKIPAGVDGELVEVDFYGAEHRPQEHAYTGRYPVNPVLRQYFDQTPNELREELEVLDWWDLPFILTDTWESREPYHKRRLMAGQAGSSEIPLSAMQIEERCAAGRQEWLSTWPTGLRYEVRCLDGGAWDRSTSWGMFASLDDAVAKCNAGPVWRAELDKMSVDVRRAAGLPVDLMDKISAARKR